MEELETECPWLYQRFSHKDFHCVRGIDKFWTGLWTDLIIEQTMMRSLKSLGGLTRGQGIGENTRNLWVATLHSCAKVENRMCSVNNTSYQSSEQHKELDRSRCQRDYEDLLKFHDWFKQFNPFDVQDKRLRSLNN